MESHKDERPVSRELAGGGSQGAKEHFYKLPDNRIPNCPPSQLDSYYRARAAYAILTGGSRRPLTYRTMVAALLAAEFVAAWDKVETATDEAMQYGFFKIALRKLVGLHAHGGNIRLGRGRLL